MAFNKPKLYQQQQF